MNSPPVTRATWKNNRHCSVGSKQQQAKAQSSKDQEKISPKVSSSSKDLLSGIWRNASAAAAKAAKKRGSGRKHSTSDESSSSPLPATSSSSLFNWTPLLPRPPLSSSSGLTPESCCSSDDHLTVPGGESSGSKKSRSRLETDLRNALFKQQSCCSNMDKLIDHRTQLVKAHLVSGNDEAVAQNMRNITKYKAQRQHAQRVSRQLRELAMDMMMVSSSKNTGEEELQERLENILHHASIKQSALACSFTSNSAEETSEEFAQRRSSSRDLLSVDDALLERARCHVAEREVSGSNSE